MSKHKWLVESSKDCNAQHVCRSNNESIDVASEKMVSFSWNQLQNNLSFRELEIKIHFTRFHSFVKLMRHLILCASHLTIQKCIKSIGAVII